MGNSSKPNLRSRSTARVLDAISEGPIWGLLDGDKSIYLNGTQLQNNGGGYNFRGVRTNERKGTVDQTPIKGYRKVTNEVNDGRQIRKSSSISFTISDEDVDAVALKIRVNALYKNTDKGKMKSNAVELEIDRRPNGGSFTKVGTVRIKGRTTSAYERGKRIDLPEGGHPYTIRIRRLTDDNIDPQQADDTYLTSYTIITDLTMRYSYTAHIGLEIDAQRYGGSSFPERRYRVGGILCEYPSNYNPNTRVYTGVWNGTFTSGQRCDNPAWILRDLAMKTRYGLGSVMDATSLDKWALYSIAQYCDGLVDDGQGGTEPRFRYNGAIETPEDGAKALDRIASIFRGMIYWQSGSITFTNDAPSSTVVANATTANVIDGHFSYSGSAKKARHSTVMVAWNDPARLGERSIEYVSRESLILKYGYQPIELGLVGCTSRGQAHRAGEWLLDTEEFETELVTYRTGLDHAKVRPGNIVAVYDPWYAGARMGGRVKAINGRDLTLDAPYSGGNGTIRVTLPDGTIQERTITSVNGDTVRVNTAFSPEPIIGAVYGIANTNINPRLFRVVSASRVEDNIFEINALFYDPTKYDRVERGVNLVPLSYTNYDTNVLPVPSGLDITETKADNGDEYAPSATLSWKPANDARVTRYGVQVFDADDTDWQDEVEVFGTSFSYEECPLGALKFRVRSLGDDYAASDYVESATDIIVGYPEPTAYTALTAVGRFRKIVVKFAENLDPKFKRARIWASMTNSFATATLIDYAPAGQKRYVHEDLGKVETWYYWIEAEDKYGRVSARFPATNTTSASATTKAINDDDTIDDTLAAPTNLTLAKVQDNDEDGPVRTMIEMVCTPPAWATDKTKYEWEISFDGKRKIDRSGDSDNLWRVHKIGDLHTVRVRAVQGVGKRGEWSAPRTITPTKKMNNVPTPSGVSANAKPKGNRVKIANEPNNFKDMKWVLFYSNDTNNSGSAELRERRKGFQWRDDDPPGVAGQITYYWARYVDNSDNIGNFSSVASCVNRDIEDGDLDDRTPEQMSPPSITTATADVDDDGKQEALLRFAWNTPSTGPDIKFVELEIYRSATSNGTYQLWKEFTINGDKTSKRVVMPNTRYFYKGRVKGISFKGKPGPFSNLTSSGVKPTKRGLNLSTAGVSVRWKSFRRKHEIQVLNAPVDNPEFAFLEIYDKQSGERVYRGRGDTHTRHNPPNTTGYRARVYDLTDNSTADVSSPGSSPTSGNDGVDDIASSDLSPGCVTTVKLEDSAVTGPKLAHNIVEANDKELGATVSSNVVIDISCVHGDADHVLVWAQFTNKEGAERSDIDISLERSGGPTFASITDVTMSDGEIAQIFGRIGQGSLSSSGTTTLQLRVSGSFAKGDRKIMVLPVW